MLDRRRFLLAGSWAVPSMPALLSHAQESQTSEDKWYWYPGHLLTMKAIGKDTGNTCTWMLNENSPREGVPFHKHLYEDESFYVVQGIYEISVGGRTVTGGVGTYVYGPRNVPHRWTNRGTSRGRILNVFTPSGIEDYFLSVAIPITNHEEKPAVDLAAFQSKTAALREKYGLIRTGPLRFPTP